VPNKLAGETSNTSLKTNRDQLEINPRDKLMLDALIDVSERDRSRRQWWIWSIIFALSCVAWFVVYQEVFAGWMQLSLVILGTLGILCFLIFLSTKPFGHGWDLWWSWWT